MARLELRRRLWYALHDIPVAVQHLFGGRVRFVKSLGTDSKTEARKRMKVLEGQWIAAIDRAGQGGSPMPERDLEFWKRVYSEAEPEHKGLIAERISEEAKAELYAAANRAGIVDERDPAFEDLPEYDAAIRFVKRATGQIIETGEHVEAWLETKGRNTAKTKDQKRSTIARFTKAFPYLTDIKKTDVQRWANELATKHRYQPDSIKRELSVLRGYWEYLQSLGHVPHEVYPFDKIKVSESAVGDGEGDRQPFEPCEVVTLLGNAVALEDQQLADLIRLGMWTGARLESLASLKIAEVDLEGRWFKVLEDKTEAGKRTVPIHSKLLPTMRRLVESSTDGYVLSGLSPNKYGDRGGALGKRFTRLKREAGFDGTKVYHSLRKTVAGLLKAAEVPEFIAADIVGHDLDTMTYGLYAGGVAIEIKREAIEKMDYPERANGDADLRGMN